MEVGQRTGYQILGEGLESILDKNEFRRAMEKVADDAYTVLFAAQAAGTLTWKRVGEKLQDFVTEVAVQNGRNESVTITVTLFTSYSEVGGMYAFLMLGSKEHAPCRNSGDRRVLSLIEQLTGAPLN